jgi:hypothetical protein
MSGTDEAKSLQGRNLVTAGRRASDVVAALWFVLVGFFLLATTDTKKDRDARSAAVASVSANTGSSTTTGGSAAPVLRVDAPTVTLTPEIAARPFSLTMTVAQSDSMSNSGASYSAKFVGRHMLNGQITEGAGAVSLAATVTDSVSASVANAAFTGEGFASGNLGFDGDCTSRDPSAPTPCQARLTVHLEQSIANDNNWSTEIHWYFEFWPNPDGSTPVEWEATFEEL